MFWKAYYEKMIRHYFDAHVQMKGKSFLLIFNMQHSSRCGPKAKLYEFYI